MPTCCPNQLFQLADGSDVLISCCFWISCPDQLLDQLSLSAVEPAIGSAIDQQLSRSALRPAIGSHVWITCLDHLITFPNKLLNQLLDLVLTLAI